MFLSIIYRLDWPWCADGLCWLAEDFKKKAGTWFSQCLNDGPGLYKVWPWNSLTIYGKGFRSGDSRPLHHLKSATPLALSSSGKIQSKLRGGDHRGAGLLLPGNKGLWSGTSGTTIFHPTSHDCGCSGRCMLPLTIFSLFLFDNRTFPHAKYTKGIKT